MENAPVSCRGVCLIRRVRPLPPSHPLQILQGLSHAGANYPSPRLLVVVPQALQHFALQISLVNFDLVHDFGAATLG